VSPHYLAKEKLLFLWQKACVVIAAMSSWAPRFINKHFKVQNFRSSQMILMTILWILDALCDVFDAHSHHLIRDRAQPQCLRCRSSAAWLAIHGACLTNLVQQLTSKPIYSSSSAEILLSFYLVLYQNRSLWLKNILPLMSKSIVCYYNHSNQIGALSK